MLFDLLQLIKSTWLH